MSELAQMVVELERVARAAGAVALSGWRRGTEVHKKGEIDLVTEFDLASEALIMKELARSLPGVSLVGEEAGAARTRPPEGGLAVYIDPIDGTTNFAHGHPFFAVSLGLCRDGVPLAGVIFAPALDTLWRGVVGEGATRNGVVCRVSERAESLQDALCATGFGYDVVGGKDDNIAEFAAVQARCRGMRRCGAAALDLALVADGTYDAYWEFMLQPWDLSAGAALVLAAGGRVSSFAQTELDVRTGAVIASNGRVHAALQQVIHEARGGRPVPERRP